MSVKSVGRYSLVLILALVTMLSACNQPTNQTDQSAVSEKGELTALAQKIDAYIEPYVAARDFAGVVLVSRNDETLYKKAFGMANVSTETQHRIEGVFETGSISKTFTAAAIIQLKNNGKLALNDSIAKFWDGHPRGQEIAIRDLLLYQAGIPDETAFPDFLEKRDQGLSLEAYAEWIATQPLAYEPGTDGSYNNFSYLLLAYLVERISGQRFDEYLQEKILMPLSLSATKINKAETSSSDSVTGYSPGPPPKLLREHPSENPAINTGSGNVLSTAEDLDLWLQSVNSKNQIDILSEEYPYGWGRREYFGRDAIEQTGIVSGFSSGILLFSDENLRIVFLSNIRTGKFFKSLHIDLAAIALGEEYELPKLQKYTTTMDNRSDYTGVYIFPNVSDIKIEPKNDLLYFTWEKFDLSTYLYPIENDQFYNRMDDAVMGFSRDDNGNVDVLIWSPGENELVNPKRSE